MQLITIKESHSALDLVVLKSRLESDGIECYIEGELTSQVLNHIPSMQAKLKISKIDFEKVKEILIENGEWQSDETKVVCPKCGSEKYRAKRSIKEKWRLVVSVIMTLVTFLPVNNSYRPATFVCDRCENEFPG
ncbi:MAG: hypothetical protein HQ522_22985 [Bacteroidetes bacterium]|nr:hypothetical protein [Bacteroidota bacterium]